ncbi:MAG TPA: hypothetical protein DD670_09540, partial [Planctomycetaceae bacterium]|nr:hypothetical protein [Planctomycetaceae bacterium]
AEQALAAANGDRRGKAEVALAVGGIYAAVGRHDEAARWYARFVEWAGDVEGTYQPLAASLAKQGRMDEAMELCLKAAEGDASPRPALVLASVLLAGAATEADFARAEPMLTGALEKHPQETSLHSLLAGVYLVQEKGEKAVALYRAALEANPTDVMALNNLAMALAETPDGADEALTHVDRAIRLAGPLANLADTKGTILLRAGKADEAKSWLERAAAVPRPDPRYQLHLAEACWKLDDLTAARTWFERARGANLTAEILTRGDREAVAALEKALNP